MKRFILLCSILTVGPALAMDLADTDQDKRAPSAPRGATADSSVSSMNFDQISDYLKRKKNYGTENSVIGIMLGLFLERIDSDPVKKELNQRTNNLLKFAPFNDFFQIYSTYADFRTNFPNSWNFYQNKNCQELVDSYHRWSTVKVPKAMDSKAMMEAFKKDLSQISIDPSSFDKLETKVNGEFPMPLTQDQGMKEQIKTLISKSDERDEVIRYLSSPSLSPHLKKLSDPEKEEFLCSIGYDALYTATVGNMRDDESQKERANEGFDYKRYVAYAILEKIYRDRFFGALKHNVKGLSIEELLMKFRQSVSTSSQGGASFSG